jgi:hypothetical protein
VYNTLRETTLCVWRHIIFSVHSPTSGYCVLSHIPMVWRHVKVVRQRTSRATSHHFFITTVWWYNIFYQTGDFHSFQRKTYIMLDNSCYVQLTSLLLTILLLNLKKVCIMFVNVHVVMDKKKTNQYNTIFFNFSFRLLKCCLIYNSTTFPTVYHIYLPTSL